MTAEDPAAAVVARFRADQAERVRALVDDDLIEEHRTAVGGRHGDRLERVLRYFRAAPIAGKHVIFRLGDHYRIGVLGREPELLVGHAHETEREAQHDVFLLRIASLRSEAADPPTEPIPRPAQAIHGYADALSVAPGSPIRFFVHAEGADTFAADLVRHDGPAAELPVPSAVDGTYPAREQAIRAGSCILVEDPEERLATGQAGSLHAFVYPTAPERGRQGILTRRGVALGLDERGRPTLWLDDEAFELPQPLRARAWYGVGCSWDAEAGIVRLHAAPATTSANAVASPLGVDPRALALEREVALEPPGAGSAGLAIAAFATAAGVTEHHYNGKVESPRVYDRALSLDELAALSSGAELDAGLVARWDFAAEIAGDGVGTTRVVDVGGRFPGTCVNMPARAVTGRSWDGTVVDYRFAPSQYAAIHFHDDDLDDAGWCSACALTVPDESPSGLYSLRIATEHAEDRIPFVVRPRPGRPASKVAFLVPTASYLAYANQMPMFGRDDLQSSAGKTPVLGLDDLYLHDHPEYAYSTYDRHADGSGIAYSSRLRPILNMRPASDALGNLWGMSADLCLIGWLRAAGVDADFVTDEDLHREGHELLRGYRAVLTGSHPEYVSARMLDALEAYVDGGGRLMYLGGNGFYWVISFDPERPHVLEVRKRAGTRAWEAAPGEWHHSSTGELGGLWRDRARPPQKLVGVGFTAQGFVASSHYRRVAAGDAPETAFIVEGIAPDEPIGGFGLSGDGAAGLELDRYDLALGTPPGAHLLASSESHTDTYQRVVEEVEVMTSGLGGTENAAVRADMTYFRTPGGGAVFSTGSIAWCQSLPVDGYRNNVARITHNVLRGFLADEIPTGRETQ
ncbi:MAG TPA: N,N-dimethylformamidase beta subunit family domain-containing protein [Solirubrobacteraceae bacterium]|nr:N,N-dimethylformamidase beta subunit family domain-containing protein [Solirubrobacteraceae bacterium]